MIKRSTAKKARTSPEIQKWMPASEQRKTERKPVFPQTWAAVVTASLPQKPQESRGQKRSTRDAGNVPAKQNSESEQFAHFDGSWRYSASTHPSCSSDTNDTGEPGRAHCTCCCGGNVSDGCAVENVANRDHCNQPGRYQWTRRIECHLRSTCPSVTCLFYLFSDESTPCTWSLCCLCARSLLGSLCWMIYILCCTKRSHRKSVTGLSCRGPIRRHRCARRRHSKGTSHKRKQNLFTAYQMLELARILLFLRVISWQIGWLGTRVGEAAVPGPAAMKQVHRVT